MAIAACLVFGAAGVGHAQQQGGSHGAPQAPFDAGTDPRVPRVPSEVQERMERARNDERQKRLVADTDRLLALATSLKQDVDRTDKNTFSLDVLRRTEEIEKLSRAIRERMKQ